MYTYVIDREDRVTIRESDEAVNAAEGTEQFNSLEQFTQLAAGWPANRLVKIWNNLPEVVPVRKFKNRQVGVSRVWKVLICLNPTVAPASPQEARRQPGRTSLPTATKKRASARQKADKRPRNRQVKSGEGSKKAMVLTLLRRSAGATLSELTKATGWQPHSVRGFLSGAVGKKLGLTVESAKRDDGERFYRVVE